MNNEFSKEREFFFFIFVNILRAKTFNKPSTKLGAPRITVFIILLYTMFNIRLKMHVYIYITSKVLQFHLNTVKYILIYSLNNMIYYTILNSTLIL